MRRGNLAVILLLVLVAAVAVAQGPRLRRHLAVGVRAMRLTPATQQPPTDSKHTIEVHGEHRHVSANGMPDHAVGRFPNHGNPHRIREQRHRFRLPANPVVADKITPLHQASRRGPPNLPFGVAVNGVLFDPGTAEFWQGDRRTGWNYEALGGAVPLGIDTNHAHVQPSGSYHYHGLPTLLLEDLGTSPEDHSPLVGWAADGFPIYALYGYQRAEDPESGIAKLTSSYRLRRGSRPAGPGGKYDGTFVQDYEFISGAGDLDACNGRHCVTPDYPEGTYAYFLTEAWPVVPRAFRGTPVRLR